MRTLTTYWPTRNLNSNLFSEMDRFFEDFEHLLPVGSYYDERSLSPSCDISETEAHYLLSLDLPGMKKEDMKIEVKDDILTVSGERKHDDKLDKKHIHRMEKSYGFFKRSFTLPNSIDSQKVEAHYENGVLYLYLPKLETAKPRPIEIQSGRTGFLDKLLGSKKNSSELRDVSSVKEA